MSILRHLYKYLFAVVILMITLSLISDTIYGDYLCRKIEYQAEASVKASSLLADNYLATILDYVAELDKIESAYKVTLADHSEKISETSLLALLSGFEANTGIQPFFFSRNDPSYIFSSSGKLKYSEFESRMSNEKINCDLNRLFSRMLTVDNGVFFKTQEGQNLIFIAPLGSNWLRHESSIMMLTTEDQLVECFQTMALPESTSCYAICKDGSLAFSSLGSEASPISSASLLKATEGGITQINTEAGNVTLLRKNSETRLLTYVVAIPTKDFYENWYNLQTKMRLLLFSMILIAVLSFIFFSYIPWRRAYIRIMGTAPSGSHSKDLKKIVQSFENTQTSISTLEERLESSMNTMKRQLLLSLINGRFRTRQELDSYCTKLMIRLEHPVWLSVFISPVPQCAQDWNDRVLLSMEGLEIPKTEIIFGECQWENGIGIILNYEPSDYSKEEIGKLLMDYLNKNGFHAMTVGIGTAEQNWQGVGMSFYRALSASRENPEIAQNGPVFWTEDSIASPLSLDTSLLSEAITFGNLEVAEGALRELTGKIAQHSENKLMLRLMQSDILNVIIRCAGRQESEINKALLYKAAEASSVEGFHETVLEMLGGICNKIQKRRSDDSLQEYDNVISFITENYKCADLSLSLVAEEMKMSMSKTSVLLKEKLGCSFLQYVTMLRMNEVKRLLRDTDHSVQMIIEEVGYHDVSSFVRKFKKIEGVSPTQYRMQHTEK